jgi:hypothetical protein
MIALVRSHSWAGMRLSCTSSDKEAHCRIEIPRSMNLRVHCSAGDLAISGISGDKDVEWSAGNLTIAVGDARASAMPKPRSWLGIFRRPPSARRWEPDLEVIGA